MNRIKRLVDQIIESEEIKSPAFNRGIQEPEKYDKKWGGALIAFLAKRVDKLDDDKYWEKVYTEFCERFGIIPDTDAFKVTLDFVRQQFKDNVATKLGTVEDIFKS